MKKDLKLHRPRIEKIITGVPAKDFDPFGEEEVDDDNEIDAAAKGDKAFAAFFAERMAKFCVKPEPAEIELAQSDLADVFADVHKLGKDFLGFIVSR